MQIKNMLLIAITALCMFVLPNGKKCDGKVCYKNEHNIHFGNDPFRNWEECYSSESPPDIIAYHLHVAFNGTDQQSISFAYKQYHNFIDYINKDMNVCSFSHSTAASVNQQTEICYFPTPWKEADFPIISNPILGVSNYAFFLPLTYLQTTLNFFFQHHYDYIVHSISGCQINDHSKWMVKSNRFSGNFTTNNLLCCHHGPSLCTCDIVQYEMNNGRCLGIMYDGNNAVFIATECEKPPIRSFGSWREVIYDKTHNYVQIENFGNAIHPIYICLGIESDNNMCTIGSQIQIIDCSYNQDISKNIWVSKSTQFMYDRDRNQIRFIGCSVPDLCVHVNQQQADELKLTVSDCSNATIFGQRHFFP